MMKQLNREKLVMLLTILFSVNIFSAGAELLDLNATIFNGTCDISVPNEVVMSQAYQNVFSQPGSTSEVRRLTLKVGNCTGVPSVTRKAAILVKGAMSHSEGMDRLFRDETSTANGIGIMLKEGSYSGSLNSYYSSPGTVRSGDRTQKKSLEGSLSDRELEYSIGLTRGMSNDLGGFAGTVKAGLEFTFVYD